MFKWVIYFMFFCSLAVSGQTIKVFNSENLLPIKLTSIFVNNKEYKTNEKAEFVIEKNNNNDTYKFRLQGYLSVTLSGNEIKKSLNIVYLSPLEDLNEVVVSNIKWSQKLRNVPKQFIKISEEEIENSNAQTSADLLQKTGQVFVQKSQLGGGSPSIRGFSTNRLLISVDGVRLNNAIFRSGNLQNIISIDPFLLESAEVILGPGSVVYGSDAIGGTLNFKTKNPKYSLNEKPKFSGNGIYRFSSANSEKTFHADISVGLKKWAFLTSVSYSDFGDLIQGRNGPSEFERNSYVTTIDNVDQVVLNNNPNKQVSTGFNQSSFLQKIHYKPNEKLELKLDLVYNTTSNFDRYDRLIRTDETGQFTNAEWFYGPQDWLKVSNVIDFKKKINLFDNLRLINTYQFFEESRNSRDFGSLIRSNNTEKLHAYNFNIDAEKKKSNHAIYYGLEYVFNTVNSTAFNLDISTNEKSSLTTRYPDGATWNSLAGYLVLNWDVNSKLALSGGLRYNYILLDAQFANSELDFPFTEANVNTGAFTGSAGATYKLSNKFLLKGNIGTAFRAPNIDDIGKINQDSEPGTLIVPNPNLKPEYAYSSELSLLYKTNKHYFSIAGYYNFLDNAISLDEFTLNGESSVLFEGELSDVRASQNSANLFTYGIEVIGEASLFKNLKAKASLTITKGEETQSDGDKVPVRHVSPTFGNVHLVYSKKKWQIDAYLDFNGGFNFDELAPSEQGKPDLFSIDDNGNPFLESWYTLNIKSQINLNKSLSLNIALENITDQRYRTYSSGISAPGINFVSSLKYGF